MLARFRNAEALVEDEEPQRPIEASLAQALAWGAPMWILDQDGPPAATDRHADLSVPVTRIGTCRLGDGSRNRCAARCRHALTGLRGKRVER